MGQDAASETQDVEKSRISANLMSRVAQCIAGSEQERRFEAALRAVGLSSLEPFASQKVSQRQLAQVVEALLPAVPDITLRMLSRAELSDLGVMGYAVISSATVGQALRFQLRYHQLTSDRFRDHLGEDDEWVTIRPVPLTGLAFDLQNIAEDCFAGNWRVLTILLGAGVDYRQAGVSFDFPEPAYAATYRRVFAGCAIRFDAGANELRFPSAWMARPIETANQTMADVCKTMCERLLGGGESVEMPQVVRRLLLSRPGHRMYRLEEAASELHLSSMQLRKRLYRAGTTYKQIVLEIRMSLARHYLLDTSLAIQEIAYLLDYSQPAPFSRAFKSYFGCAPEQFRQRSRSKGL